jgi:hypothetical protein
LCRGLLHKSLELPDTLRGEPSSWYIAVDDTTKYGSELFDKILDNLLKSEGFNTYDDSADVLTMLLYRALSMHGNSVSSLWLRDIDIPRTDATKKQLLSDMFSAMLNSNDKGQVARALQALGHISVGANLINYVDWPIIIERAVHAMTHIHSDDVMFFGLETVKLAMQALYSQQDERFVQTYLSVGEAVLSLVHSACIAANVWQYRGLALLYSLCVMCPIRVDIAANDDEVCIVPYYVKLLKDCNLDTIKLSADAMIRENRFPAESGPEIAKTVLYFVAQTEQLTAQQQQLHQQPQQQQQQHAHWEYDP